MDATGIAWQTPLANQARSVISRSMIPTHMSARLADETETLNFADALMWGAETGPWVLRSPERGVPGGSKFCPITGLGTPQSRSIEKEALEPLRRQLGVADRVCDGTMAEVVLDGARVLALAGQVIAQGMP